MGVQLRRKIFLQQPTRKLCKATFTAVLQIRCLQGYDLQPNWISRFEFDRRLECKSFPFIACTGITVGSPGVNAIHHQLHIEPIMSIVQSANSAEGKEIDSFAWCCEFPSFYIHGSTDVESLDFKWNRNTKGREWSVFLNVEIGGQGLHVRVSDPFLQSCFVDAWKKITFIRNYWVL